MKLDALLQTLDKLARTASDLNNTADMIHSKLRAAGYSDREIGQFCGVGESMPALLETMATMVVMARDYHHIPSAKVALGVLDYTEEATHWLYGTMKKADIDPEVLGWRRDTVMLERRLALSRSWVRDTLADYERRQENARQAQTVN